jgi:hypothetical protein
MPQPSRKAPPAGRSAAAAGEVIHHPPGGSLVRRNCGRVTGVDLGAGGYMEFEEAHRRLLVELNIAIPVSMPFFCLATSSLTPASISFLPSDGNERKGRGLMGDSPQKGETKPQEPRPRPNQP